MVAARRIGKRSIAILKPGQVVWDGDVSGFGARRQADSVSYVLIYRTAEGRQRWHTIGRHGSPWTPDEARKEAKRLLGSVARGLDPAEARIDERRALTFEELCDLYFAEGVAHKKPSTLRSDRARARIHL